MDGPYFHLSFDDDLRYIVTNAVPILMRLRVPVIFFVPTAFIDSDMETARRYSVDIAEYAAPIEMARWDDLQATLRGWNRNSAAPGATSSSTWGCRVVTLRGPSEGSRTWTRRRWRP